MPEHCSEPCSPNRVLAGGTATRTRTLSIQQKHAQEYTSPPYWAFAPNPLPPDLPFDNESFLSFVERNESFAA